MISGGARAAISYTFFRPLDPLPLPSRRRPHHHSPPTVAFHSKTAYRTKNPVENIPTGRRFCSVTLLSPSTTEQFHRFIRVSPVSALLPDRHCISTAKYTTGRWRTKTRPSSPTVFSLPSPTRQWTLYQVITRMSTRRQWSSNGTSGTTCYGRRSNGTSCSRALYSARCEFHSA